MVKNHLSNSSGKTIATLWYFHDPMCSWCFGFAETWRVVESGLPAGVDSAGVVGGLAADDEAAMPAAMAGYLQQVWRQVEGVYGVEFNFDFWRRCVPRRSTYPACRAVIAAGEQWREMTAAIQSAYYRQAQNPSDVETLADCAVAIGLRRDEFLDALRSAAVERELQRQLHFTRACGVAGFPSLRLRRGDALVEVPVSADAEAVLGFVAAAISGGSA